MTWATSTVTLAKPDRDCRRLWMCSAPARLARTSNYGRVGARVRSRIATLGPTSPHALIGMHAGWAAGVGPARGAARRRRSTDGSVIDKKNFQFNTGSVALTYV